MRVERVRPGHRHQRQLSRRLRRHQPRLDRAIDRAAATVTGTGNNDVIGGFVGANFGSIDSSSAAGNATGGHRQRGRRLRRRQCHIRQLLRRTRSRARASRSAPSPIPPPPARPAAAPGARSTRSSRSRPHDRLQPAGVSLDHRGLHRPHLRVREHWRAAVAADVAHAAASPRPHTPAALPPPLLARIPGIASGAADASDPQPHQHRAARRAQHPARWSTSSRAPSGCRRSPSPPAAGQPEPAARLRPQDRRHPAAERDPLHPGRGGGADRAPMSASTGCGPRRRLRLDGAGLGKPRHHRVDRGALAHHQRPTGAGGDPGARRRAARRGDTAGIRLHPAAAISRSRAGLARRPRPAG